MSRPSKKESAFRGILQRDSLLRFRRLADRTVCKLRIDSRLRRTWVFRAKSVALGLGPVPAFEETRHVLPAAHIHHTFSHIHIDFADQPVRRTTPVAASRSTYTPK